MILNERVLRLVVILAEELHFGRASSRLNLSQPALSGSLKNLEIELGVRLFRRTSRSVALTEAGEILAAEARRLIKESEHAVARVRGSSSAILGPLRVGYPLSINLRWLGALITNARRRGFLNPDLVFISTDAAAIEEDLIKGSLHAAFLAGRFEHPAAPDVYCVRLFREALLAVLPAGHSLSSGVSNGLKIGQLLAEPVVWLEREADPTLHDSFASMCRAQGYTPNLVQGVRTFHECLEFVRQGVGITFLPLSMRSPGEDLSITFHQVPDSSFEMQCTLAYCRKSGDAAIDRFVQFVREHVSGVRARAAAY